MAECVVSADSVSYIYPDGTVGVQDVTLEIYKEERVALIGPNGCGKSTLLLLFAGLLKPTKGRLKILGREIEEKNREFIRKNVGILFQNPDDFLFNPTVLDELLYTPLNMQLDLNTAKDLALKYSSMFELEQILNKPPYRLSSGEKKRVALACVFMSRPQLLLLDEPFTSVDKKTKQKIVDMIEGYEGTLIISTHETEYIEHVVNKVVLLSAQKRVRAIGNLNLIYEYEKD